MRRFDIILLTAFLGLALVAGTADAGKLYKWVDKDGKVHYTDSPPPEASKQQREVLNDQGMVTETLSRQKTPEEIAAEKAKQDELDREKQAEKEQAAKDHMLTSTYTSTEELEMARDGRVQALESQVRVVSGTINNLENRLGGMEQQAAQLKAANKPVPPKLETDIKNTRAELLENQKFLIETQQKQEDIKTQYNADIERFKKLKGK